MMFRDRSDAGQRLGAQLEDYAHRPDVVVLGLPRGGVPVAFEVARLLEVPLDVFMVRKLGVPGHEELALGAIASGGVRVLNEDIVDTLGLSEREIAGIEELERAELERRERQYRGDRPRLDVRGQVVILVDDGLATGASMRAAVTALRRLSPARIVVAVPVADPSTCDALQSDADAVVCTVTPQPFMAVGLWYEDFSQTTDEEVRALLHRAARPNRVPRGQGSRHSTK
jgi:predicted phosphoribosyltransferase